MKPTHHTRIIGHRGDFPEKAVQVRADLFVQVAAGEEN